MIHISYFTDLEWEIIEPLFPKNKLTCPLKWTKKQIFNGIFYKLKKGMVEGINS